MNAAINEPKRIVANKLVSSLNRYAEQNKILESTTVNFLAANQIFSTLNFALLGAKIQIHIGRISI